jgi:hypothetical protein
MEINQILELYPQESVFVLILITNLLTAYRPNKLSSIHYARSYQFAKKYLYCILMRQFQTRGIGKRFSVIYF